MNEKHVSIEYFTDVLCVWAWAAQPRIEELKSKFGRSLLIHHRYVDVFGDVNYKLEKQWQPKGGVSAFAEHVQKTMEEFPEIAINSDVWVSNIPRTSANSHLVIKAVESTYNIEASEQAAIKIRKAFFIDNLDISQMNVLLELMAELGHSISKINSAIENGEALASLMQDYQRARQLNIKGSPSYVMNHERQILYGNVGYRVLHANVEELLRHPENEASWC